MLQVVIIGSGNVAQHLIKAFSGLPKVQLVQAFARKPETLLYLLPSGKITNTFNDLADADVYIISVSDDAIASVSSQLVFKDKLVVHTSGSAGLDRISNANRRGVFYPLQTFSKDKEIDFSTVPLCLESEFENDYATLQQLATSLSKSVYNINSAQRQSLHVSAVFVCNFVNHLYNIGNSICNDNNIPFAVLLPLIQETANKVSYLTPFEAQTGPAVRNDETTLKKHLDFLQDNNQKAIYTLLTQSIQKTYE